jgi:hypothetical protein
MAVRMNIAVFRDKNVGKFLFMSALFNHVVSDSDCLTLKEMLFGEDTKRRSPGLAFDSRI